MISVVILAKNEEESLAGCLKSVSWADEVLVIDDNSTDKTAQIAESLGAEVVTHPLKADFASQRNFAMSRAGNDWVLFLDADEKVSDELQIEILKEINKKDQKCLGFYFKREDYFGGKWLKHGEIAGVRILRLAKRTSGRWERKVDEKWNVGGKTKTLKKPLKHYSHRDLKQFLETINTRSTQNALVFFENGVKVTIFEWAKPIIKFIDNFIFKFGFLDGEPGFVFAVLMSLHSFMVRAKLYLLWQRK